MPRIPLYGMEFNAPVLPGAIENNLYLTLDCQYLRDGVGWTSKRAPESFHMWTKKLRRKKPNCDDTSQKSDLSTMNRKVFEFNGYKTDICVTFSK